MLVSRMTRLLPGVANDVSRTGRTQVVFPTGIHDRAVDTSGLLPSHPGWRLERHDPSYGTAIDQHRHLVPVRDCAQDWSRVLSQFPHSDISHERSIPVL